MPGNVNNRIKPEGLYREMEVLGLKEPKSGDILLCRNKSGQVDGLENII